MRKKKQNIMSELYKDIDSESAILQLIGVAAIDGDNDARKIALKILGSYPGDISFIYLRDVLLNSEEEDLRAEAASSLGEEGDPIALRVLERVILNPDEKSETVKLHAKKAIKELLGIA